MLAALVIGLGVQSCASTQVAVPAGPGSAAPSVKPTASTHPSDKSTPSDKADKAKPSKESKPSASSTASAKADPTATKPAKPVRPKGNIKQRSEDTHKVSYESKKPLHQTARFDDGVTVAVTKVTAAKAAPVGPGEVGGAAVATTVKITNGSAAPIDLGTVSVTLSGSDGTPGIVTTGGKSAPLAGTLDVDGSSRGTYVFTLAESLRKPVTVHLQYGSGRTVLQFSGNVG
ncbi:hypothetical protein [Microlunatus soli]|uniref:DUF4352 domain-containing protein n=1 Tax=Microlunatus soli TaxID=630515 RepID=A0A1H1SQI7_9ACTN|nr:hypothetical protein [Microlunatus soli]SDS50244.1 hypothetical protein SAMN04489812_2100 [Microlunatus soli]